ncbi:SurA N-terminal domain-containing protein [Salinicoccus sp. ID82-1]|uniref:SurA N-terminal domain-containing protein n=1 Tax=Salinicoccus sp. ID82-1 TaxID=2820269 RepID=UPI001F174AED|nr:SurA N-terminal domain-containing protein [Salinicoccus sp. ID82-1]MCG1010293.1 SurA N-terminal domain-containing protein [Salinicoccus sp. ID82-1]
MKKWLLGLSLGTFAVVMTACSGGDESAENTNEEAQTQEEVASDSSEEAATTEGSTEEGAGQQMEMPEPDLEDVPDVVATVNGEEITKDEFEQVYTAQFQQAAMQAQMTGQEMDQAQMKQQIAEGMVSQELLKQEAEDRGIEATDEEIDAAIDDLVERNGLESREALFTALEEQGLTEEEARAELQSGLNQDQLISEEIGEIEVTEEELQTLYDDTVQQQEEAGSEQELPPFEELKPDLESHLKQQKEAEATQNYASELRENADVTINL